MKRTDIIRGGLACASALAGVAHLFAAADHLAHLQVTVFFGVLAVAQFAWAGYIVASPNRSLLGLGAALNAGVVLLWLASRTYGTPFIPGHTGREAVGALDLAASFLEVIIVAGCLYLLEVRPVSASRPRESAALGLALGLVVLALPQLAPAPVLGHVHLAQHAHGPTHHLAAAGHVHAAGAHHTSGHGTHATGPHAAHHVARGDHGHTGHAETAHVHSPATAATASWSYPPVRGTAATVRYGPFSLEPAKAAGAKQTSPATSNIIRTRLQTPCSGCYITAFAPDLVYADGKRANFDTGVMLHHAVIGDSAHNDLTCDRSSTIGWMGQRFFASGNERTKGAFPAPYGYRVDPSDWWTGAFEIMNFVDAPQTVWFELTVHYVEAAEPITPVWLDVGNCQTSEYAIPAGDTTKVWRWQSNVTGRIVFAGGHVHNWGRYITLSNASTGEKMIKSVAGYGRDPTYQGNIDSMSVASWDRVGTVREGEYLQIAANYNAPESHDDVMGIVLAYVYETDDLRGGTPAPHGMTDPSASSGQPHPSHNH